MTSKKSRFGGRVITNRDHYKTSKDRLDAWMKWSQEHVDQIVMYTEWLEREYEED